jgi:predicted metalloprotease
MKWTRGPQSENIEDQRGARGGVGRSVGLGGGVVLLVLSLVFGHNFFADVEEAPEAGQPTAANGNVPPPTETPEEHERVQFVSFVLDDVQDTWAKIFAAEGAQYRPAKLVLFRNAVRSSCGVAESAMGPFYCPMDQKAYIDLSFYDDLRQRFGAAGDFAQAYVLAHELGHHVQHLMGTDARVRQLQDSRAGSANELSVRLELQADCYAGVWANSTQQRRLLQPGDVEEALNAAASIGDDRIQAARTGGVHPESFTHGTSQQRATWLQRGMRSGRPGACDTFGGST